MQQDLLFFGQVWLTESAPCKNLCPHESTCLCDFYPLVYMTALQIFEPHSLVNSFTKLSPPSPSFVPPQRPAVLSSPGKIPWIPSMNPPEVGIADLLFGQAPCFSSIRCSIVGPEQLRVRWGSHSQWMLFYYCGLIWGLMASSHWSYNAWPGLSNLQIIFTCATNSPCEPQQWPWIQLKKCFLRFSFPARKD